MKLNNFIVIILFSVGFTPFTTAQQHPGFIYPLDSVQQYISLFNALRDNHFHSGFDLKTQEKEGLPVLAADDGYVSRIKIQSVGYGKAIYIDHPNGYTTVYGHLNTYSKNLQSWILAHQLTHQTFEFDYVFNTPKFKVKKGDTIAYSGNTGRSTGPHVHFEIRNTVTEHPLNPLLHGFNLTDTLEPRMEALHVFVPSKNQPELLQSWEINPAKINRNTTPFFYTDTLLITEPEVLFGFEAYDYLTDSARKYMLYSACISAESDTIYGYEMTEAAFDKNKLINQFIHYKTYQQNGKRIQLGGLLTNSNQPFRQYANNNKGWVKVTPQVRNFTFSFGQVSSQPNIFKYSDSLTINPSKFTIQFAVKYALDTIVKKPLSDSCLIQIFPGKKLFLVGDYVVKFNENTFFDTSYICMNVVGSDSKKINTQFHIGPLTLPLAGNFELSTKLPLNSTSINSKWCWVNHKNAYQKTTIKNDTITCYPNQTGVYKLVADTIRPTVLTKSFKANKLIGHHLVFIVNDNLSGIKSYKGYINNQWQVFEYDAKHGTLIYFNANQLEGKKHKVKIVVEDNCGNLVTYEKIFYK